MTRRALIPVDSHNPDVEPDRPGYCVRCERTNQWACPPDKGRGGSMVSGLRVGWTQERSEVRVWATEWEAREAAQKLKCVVTTVPRWNGHCVVWSKVP